MSERRVLRRLPPIIFLIAAIGAGGRAISFPEAAGDVPGPAVAPMLLAFVLAGLGLALLARGSKPESDPEGEALTVPWAPLAGLFFAIVVYTLLMPSLGFISTTALFLVCCMRLFGHAGGVRAWAFSLAASFILYGLFAKVMGVPIPAGWMG